MTNQEVFEMLSENEARLFYAYCDDRDNKALKAAHESVNYASSNTLESVYTFVLP